MTFQRCYGGVRFLDGAGPSQVNVRRLDHGARPMFLDMMKRGMRVDLDHFHAMLKVLTDDMDRLTEEVATIAGRRINLDSGDQVSAFLFKDLGLRQARPKMTKSGDRESVENEVLVAIQHEHPVVSKLLEFKELSKLRGTYVEPMPRLAQRVGHGHWRMFPRLGDTRVPSNRLLRIALCGYEGEHEMPSSWRCLRWSAGAGYGGQAQVRSGNGDRECVWFSPHCLSDGGLFD